MDELYTRVSSATKQELYQYMKDDDISLLGYNFTYFFQYCIEENQIQVISHHFSNHKIEGLTVVNTLSNEGKNQVVKYARDLVQKEKTQQAISVSENLYEYHVYEKMSAGIGALVYDDRDYDTVYFDEELAHDFASWVSGDSMEPKYENGSVALIRETGFDYDGAVYAVVCNNQTYIKRVYHEENGLRLVSINPKYEDIFISYDEDPRVVGIIVGNFMPLKEGRNG
ncbi:S24 family peptidase [Streptococcus parasanguinis]|uniref:S24 family peptidase n=1 Tax=Streptococcus parasanguinis TaxID=1318 RepID=UPI000AD46720|nr:S24 family peptidase [Streptococcus parasanguinis]